MIDLSGVDIALGIHSQVVDPVKLSGLATAAFVLAGLIAFTAVWLAVMVGETSTRVGS